MHRPPTTERSIRLTADKPSIVVFWGDDIGIPNIDRLANEGMRFTDVYGEQSCTAGRSSFIAGRACTAPGSARSGSRAEQGMHAEDSTIAELLEPLGYVTGQFGKNHLGDRDEHLPTAHGFDEFFGDL